MTEENNVPASPVIQKKPWYKSITIWGAQIAATAIALPDIIKVVDTNLGTNLVANPIVVKIMAFFGIATAIYGRFKANTQIK